jgi:hypothetical protein
MMGRLDAPGAKLEPVMPGLENSTSPKVEPGLRWISSLGTTVTVANWSVTMGSAPCIAASDGALGVTGTASVGGGAGRRRIGLGAVTLICGRVKVSWACASGPHSGSNVEQPNINARTIRLVMTDS